GFYPPRGALQLIVDHLEPRGLGALRLAFEQLRDRLDAEGLFDPGRERPLPSIPRTLGILTPPGGAAGHHRVTTPRRRRPAGAGRRRASSCDPCWSRAPARAGTSPAPSRS